MEEGYINTLYEIVLFPAKHNFYNLYNYTKEEFKTI